jgi:hypothetical protein
MDTTVIKTCDTVIRIPEDVRGSEKRRGFQPPWYRVLVLVCPKCGHKSYLRQNWHGSAPSFGIRCGAVQA